MAEPRKFMLWFEDGWPPNWYDDGDEALEAAEICREQGTACNVYTLAQGHSQYDTRPSI